jgi:S-adenosylmethionine synthetase
LKGVVDMIEKVNPKHPDKLADRIAGAIVDLAYTKDKQPKVAVEVMLGHGKCFIIIETTVDFKEWHILPIVERIVGDVETILEIHPQDAILTGNQEGGIACGDNGIFKGVPLTQEETQLAAVARQIYEEYPYDGKYILDGDRLIICQSNAHEEDIKAVFPNADINPLGYWTGGINVDTGCTNRKLGSDMAQSVTGGGIHGKDLSKADVAVNIYAFLKAQEMGQVVEFSCGIGDKEIDGIPYGEIVETASNFIKELGGFEKFAEWGLF